MQSARILPAATLLSGPQRTSQGLTWASLRRISPSPRDVEMVAFVDHFFRARAADTDTLRVGRSTSCDKRRSWSCEIDSAASEVKRVRRPTHSAVALSSPATGGNNQVRMSCQEASEMQQSMRR